MFFELVLAHLQCSNTAFPCLMHTSAVSNLNRLHSLNQLKVMGEAQLTQRIGMANERYIQTELSL